MWACSPGSTYPSSSARNSASVMTRTSLFGSSFLSVLTRSSGAVVLVKASIFPSGDQRGAQSCGPLVMRRAGERPSVATSQRLVSYPSCLAFTVTSTYAARRPSGAICGLATHRNANRSLSEMARCCAESPGAHTSPASAIMRVGRMRSVTSRLGHRGEGIGAPQRREVLVVQRLESLELPLHGRAIRRVGGEVVQHPGHRLSVEHEAVMAHGTERVGFHLERVVAAVRAVGRHADTRDLRGDGPGLLVGEGASRLVLELRRAELLQVRERDVVQGGDRDTVARFGVGLDTDLGPGGEGGGAGRVVHP